MVLEVHQVRHALGGMVDVALQVDHVRPLLEYAGAEAVRQGCRHFLHIGVAGAQVDVVPDADELREKCDHVGGLAHRFPMGDLGTAFIQILHPQPEQIGRLKEGETCAGRLVAKNADRQSRIKTAAGDVLASQPAQGFGHGHDLLQLIDGLLPCQKEVLPVEIARE